MGWRVNYVMLGRSAGWTSVRRFVSEEGSVVLQEGESSVLVWLKGIENVGSRKGEGE